MTCSHGAPNAPELGVWCSLCYGLTLAAACEKEFWGTCDHGISLAPWVDCEQCELAQLPKSGTLDEPLVGREEA